MYLVPEVPVGPVVPANLISEILVSPPVSSVPRNFIPGRDGIQVQSRDPGIFRDGISLIFSSRDFLEIVRDFSGLTFFDAISDYLE